jgi:hypothetical protein
MGQEKEKKATLLYSAYFKGKFLERMAKNFDNQF